MPAAIALGAALLASGSASAGVVPQQTGWVLVKHNGEKQPSPRRDPRHGWRSGATLTFRESGYGMFRCENLEGDFALAEGKIVFRHLVIVVNFGDEQSPMCKELIRTDQVVRSDRHLSLSGQYGPKKSFEFAADVGNVFTK